MKSPNPLSATILGAWEVLRWTHVQMNPRLLNITNWKCCVREYRINQIMPCIPRHFCLCKKLWQVKFYWNPPNTENTWSLSLPNPVAKYGIVNLVKGWWGYTRIIDNWYVTTKYPCRTFYQYPKTSLLTPQGFISPVRTSVIVFPSVCTSPILLLSYLSSPCTLIFE